MSLKRYFTVERADGKPANILDYIAAAFFAVILLAFLILLMPVILLIVGVKRLVTRVDATPQK